MSHLLCSFCSFVLVLVNCYSETQELPTLQRFVGDWVPPHFLIHIFYNTNIGGNKLQWRKSLSINWITRNKVNPRNFIANHEPTRIRILYSLSLALVVKSLRSLSTSSCHQQQVKIYGWDGFMSVEKEKWKTKSFAVLSLSLDPEAALHFILFSFKFKWD